MITPDGIRWDGLVPLDGGRINRLYRSGDRVIKVYDHRQVPRERAEKAVQFMADAASAGLPVPAPISFPDGRRWADSSEGMVVVMPFVGGIRRTRGSLTLAEAANLGATLSRLHDFMRTYPAGSPRQPGPPSPRWQLLRESALAMESPNAFDRLVVEMADYVTTRQIPAVDWEAQPWQLIHGDLHLDNVLFDRDGGVAAVLDFDNLAPGWLGAELMICWNLSFCPDPGAPVLTPEGAAFFRAYGHAMGALPLLYWHTLASNTWPASRRYRDGSYQAEWLEIVEMRLRAARWVEQNIAEMTDWLKG